MKKSLIVIAFLLVLAEPAAAERWMWANDLYGKGS